MVCIETDNICIEIKKFNVYNQGEGIYDKLICLVYL